MKAFIHIGIGKTGTSTIQKFLNTNAKALRKQRAYYPSSPGQVSGRHLRLGAYSLRDDLYTDPRKLLALDLDELPTFRSEFSAALEAELNAMPPGIEAVIFSDEGLCSLTETAELERLQSLLAPFFDSVNIIIYLRRQDLHSVSQHSQHLKAGRLGRKRLRPSHFYDYASYLDLWAGVFGPERIIPRVFERPRFPSGDVLHDFLEVCGLKYTEEFKRTGSLNESLLPEAEVFLMHLNRELKKFVDGKRNPGRGLVIRHLLSEFSGKGMRPARRAAESFYREYARTNEAVRERWFPEQTSLFDEDFESYPKVAHDRAMDTADLMAVSSSVINRLATEYTLLRAENARLRDGDEDAAERALDARDGGGSKEKRPSSKSETRKSKNAAKGA